MARLTKELLFVSLVLSIFFTAFAAGAEEKVQQPKQPRDFAEIKAEVLKGIDARISSLQKHKTCVSAAKDQDGLRSCMDSHREEMRKMMPERPRGGMGPGGPGGPGGPAQQPPAK